MTPVVEGIVVFGEAQVGKSCFVDMLTKGRHFVSYTGVLTEDPRHSMTIDNEIMIAEFMDLSSTTVHTANPTFSSNVFIDILSRASGVVLLYDATSLESYEHVTNQAYMYVWMCKKYMGNGNRSCEFILVGNKADTLQTEPNKREVDKNVAKEWARSQGMKHFELTTYVLEQVQEAVHGLMRDIKRAKERAETERGEEKLKKKHVKGMRDGQAEPSKKPFKEKIKRVTEKRGDAGRSSS